MDRNELVQNQRDKVYALSKIEKVLEDIECFNENSRYCDFGSFEYLRDIPIINRGRIEKIIAQKDQFRSMYAALLLEIRADLLELSEDIFVGKELFEPISNVEFVQCSEDAAIDENSAE